MVDIDYIFWTSREYNIWVTYFVQSTIQVEDPTLEIIMHLLTLGCTDVKEW